MGASSPTHLQCRRLRHPLPRPTCDYAVTLSGFCLFFASSAPGHLVAKGSLVDDRSGRDLLLDSLPPRRRLCVKPNSSVYGLAIDCATFHGARRGITVGLDSAHGTSLPFQGRCSLRCPYVVGPIPRGSIWLIFIGDMLVLVGFLVLIRP